MVRAAQLLTRHGVPSTCDEVRAMDLGSARDSVQRVLSQALRWACLGGVFRFISLLMV